MICPYFKSPLFWHYFWNFGQPRFVLRSFIFREMVRYRIPRDCFLFFSTERIPSCVLFHGMARNGIPRISIYFGSTERNSELCSLPQKGSEQNYRSLLLFLFHGTELFSLPRKGLNGIPRFSVPRNNRNSVGNNHLFVHSVFHGIIFLSEIPNPSWETLSALHAFCGFRKHIFPWR